MVLPIRCITAYHEGQRRRICTHSTARDWRINHAEAAGFGCCCYFSGRRNIDGGAIDEQRARLSRIQNAALVQIGRLHVLAFWQHGDDRRGPLHSLCC
jgi:hypothetical protein